jgi:hypothetical protein
VLALTQILNVGTVALVSHAVGAKQQDRANLVFNQSLCCRCDRAVVCVGVYLVPALHAHGRGGRSARRSAGIDTCTGSRRARRCNSDGGHVRDAARHGHDEADDDPADDHVLVNIVARARC